METVSKLLTVVVPVYKVEAYINKCLDSLLVPAEQLDRLEVIVVNDGTPDRSAEMAREYERRYPGVFRVIDKENGGHGSAWNRGLEEATGKYLRFLDSDDWFDTAALSSLMGLLEGMDVDLVLSDRMVYYAETGEYLCMPIRSEDSGRVIPVSDFDWEKQEENASSFMFATYRTSMIQGKVRFLEGTFYDDTILKIAPVMMAETLCLSKPPIYYYLMGRPGQTMSVEVVARHQDALWRARKQAIEYALEHFGDLHDDSRKTFVKRVACVMLIDSFVSISDLPYAKCRKLLKDWRTVYRRVLDRFGDFSKPRAIKYFMRLPFPLFYFATRVSRHLS